MAISDQQYLAWQKRLTESAGFRRFWKFWGIYFVIFFYVGLSFLFFERWRKMAILALVAFLLARFGIDEIINYLYKKKRPFQRLDFLPLNSRLFISPVNKRFNSMPSGHAAALMAVSSVCAVFLPPLGLLSFVVTVLNGIARVILGYHHPVDILAGWVVGLVSALLVLQILSPLLFTR